MRELENATASDPARRASDTVNLHVLAGHAGKWVAIKLHDGTSDGTVYDLKRHAVRFQLHEHMCMYVQMPPDGLSPGAAERLLKIHRNLYDSGFRLTEPDAEVGLPYSSEDVPCL